jgi:hypothetical protein
MDLSMYGHAQDEVWKQIAADIGGGFEGAGLFTAGALRYKSGDFEITLKGYGDRSVKDFGASAYTCMRAPFLNKDRLYFKIYRKGIFSGLAKRLGTQDLTIGDDVFDANYMIQSNNEERVRQLLADPKLRELLEGEPKIWVEVKPDDGWFGQSLPEGTDELYFQCKGVLVDKVLIKDLFDTFMMILQKLAQMDSGYTSGSNT